ncbi:hypothetical protein [Sinomonas sp. RB5]
MYGIPTETWKGVSAEVERKADAILDRLGASFDDCTEVEAAITVMKATMFIAEARMAAAIQIARDDLDTEDLGLKISGTRHTALLTIPTSEGHMILNKLFDEAATAILRAGPALWECSAIAPRNATPEHRRVYDGMKSKSRTQGIPSDAMQRPVDADAEPWLWELGKSAVLYAGDLGLGCSMWSNGKRVTLVFSAGEDQSVAVLHHEKMKATLDEVAWGAAAAIAALTSPRLIAR